MERVEGSGNLRNRTGVSALVKGDEDGKSKPKNASKAKKLKPIPMIFVSLLLDLLAFTMILPLLPSLLDYYNKVEGNQNTLYSSLLSAVEAFRKLTGAPNKYSLVLFGGALGSMYSFLQFLTSPIVGSLSDAYGRKPMLLICLVGIAASHALWGCASSFSVFVLARFIGGLSKANVSLSMAVVSDASDEKTRTRGMALIGLAFSIAFIVGPMAGAWFAMTRDHTKGSWGQKPAAYALSLALANIILVALCVPETLPKNKRTPLRLTMSKALDYVSPLHLVKFTAVPGLTEYQKTVLSKLGPIYFLYLFVYSGLEFTITFLTHQKFGFSAMQQGKMFLIIGMIMALLQGTAARRLSARGAEKAARVALTLTPFSFLCVTLSIAPRRVPFLNPHGWLWLGLVLFAVSTAFAVSCMGAMAAAAAPSGSRGVVLGVLRSLGALARALGPLIASTVYWYFGAAATYFTGSVILAIPAVMLYILRT